MAQNVVIHEDPNGQYQLLCGNSDYCDHYSGHGDCTVF